MRIHQTPLKTGISRTPEFEKKGSATFAVNIGTKCGHECCYCSSGVVLRMHPSFKRTGESPFGFGYAIVAPDTPDRVARDAQRIKARGLVQLCTLVDAWAPEAQEYHLGRRCLEAILAEPGWTVRILTKNVAVQEDFDLIAQHRERVLVGLSLTGAEAVAGAFSAVEQKASPISERMAVLKEAHRQGLRTYGMLCHLLPGIAADPQTVDELVEFCLDCGAEEVLAEPVNPRGPGLGKTEEALRQAGLLQEAQAVGAVRKKAVWSSYVANLLSALQDSLRRRRAMAKLRFLLYPSNLTEEDKQWIRNHDQGVRWLGKERPPVTAENQ